MGYIPSVVAVAAADPVDNKLAVRRSREVAVVDIVRECLERQPRYASSFGGGVLQPQRREQ